MFEQSMRRMEEQLREAQRSAEEARRRGEESAAGARQDREETESRASALRTCEVGPGRYCPPRRRHAFEPSCIESVGIL